MIQRMDDNPTTYVRIHAMLHGERAQNSPIRVPDANTWKPQTRGFQGRRIPPLGVLAGLPQICLTKKVWSVIVYSRYRPCRPSVFEGKAWKILTDDGKFEYMDKVIYYNQGTRGYTSEPRPSYKVQLEQWKRRSSIWSPAASATQWPTKLPHMSKGWRDE